MDPKLAEFLLLFAFFVLGILFLLIGRRLFWLLGGAALALVVAIIATFILEPPAFTFSESGGGGFRLFIEPQQAQQSILAVAAIGGLVGIVFVWILPKVAVAMVGFVGGIFIVFVIYDLFQLSTAEWIRRTLFIVAGVLLTAIALRQPDQTMIILSSIVGASFVTTALNLNPESPWSAFAWLVAMLVGLVFQVNSLRLESLESQQNPGP